MGSDGGSQWRHLPCLHIALDETCNVQRHFLNELGISEAVAFFDWNFAPPTLRRNIGVLGLLHKRALGKSHPDFEKLLPWFKTVFGFDVPGRQTRQTII